LSLISSWKKFCSYKCYWDNLKGKKPLVDNTGRIAWNKGMDIGIKSYSGLHGWIYRKKGTAKKCSICGSIKNIEWANKSHEYKKDTNDFIELCSTCHRSYDKEHKNSILRAFPKRIINST